MTVHAADTSVRKSIVVAAPIERAFSVFTDGIGSWWHPDHHILEADLAELVFEPRVGGHVCERGVDGSECRWARVLVYEPPNRVVISWDINDAVGARDRPREDQRSRGALRRGGVRPDARRARAPQPRPPRQGLGADARFHRLLQRME